MESKCDLEFEISLLNLLNQSAYPDNCGNR